MLNFIKRKRAKKQQKRTFCEYGYKVDSFKIETGGAGTVEYAQWLHPFVKPKALTEESVLFYKSLFRPGAMAIDIGAHMGDTAVPMALAAGKEGLVLALEPNMYVYKILEKNASLNPQHTRIVPLCCAATAEDGTFTFNYSDASFCNGGFLSKIKTRRHGHNFPLEVKGINLERYLLENYPDDLKRLEFIKVDAEGYDAEILSSLPTIIRDYQPTMIIECYKRLTVEERHVLYDLVDGYGYDLFYLEDFEKTGEKKKIGRENMTDERHFDMLAVSRSRKLLP